MKRLIGLNIAAILLSAGVAQAACGIDAGSVRILSNDFEALHVIAAAAEECAGGSVTVTKNQTVEHKNIQVPALTTNPATYTVAVVANNSIMPLLNADLIRPLDELVAKYGGDLNPSQQIRIGGKVMAIAFMANAQHLHYRKDILEKAGLQPPTSYEDVLAAAKTIRDKGLAQYPLAASDKPGFDLAEEFVNMYVGLGGEFFKPGTATASIENEKGVKALEMMKALTRYMGPDFMTYNTNAIKPLWESGQVVIHDGWGSRASALVSPASPVPEIARNTVLAAAPTIGGGTTPAATLWWDGFAIAKNISDKDAEASFRAMVYGIRPAVAKQNAAVTFWLVKDYQATPASLGVQATIKAGAKPYPMLPYMGVLFNAIGDNLAKFMQGQEDAGQALGDATRAYNTAAKEAGYLR